MGTLQGLKLASIDWVGPLGCNSVHPDSLGSSRETVLSSWHWKEGRKMLSSLAHTRREMLGSGED